MYVTLSNTLYIYSHRDFELAVASTIGIEIDILGVVVISMAMLSWTTHPDCPDYIKPELERRICSLLSSFLLAPVADEVFVDADVCQNRLHGSAVLPGSPR